MAVPPLCLPGDYTLIQTPFGFRIERVTEQGTPAGSSEYIAVASHRDDGEAHAIGLARANGVSAWFITEEGQCDRLWPPLAR